MTSRLGTEFANLFYSVMQHPAASLMRHPASVLMQHPTAIIITIIPPVILISRNCNIPPPQDFRLVHSSPQRIEEEYRTCRLCKGVAGLCREQIYTYVEHWGKMTQPGEFCW